MPPLQAALGIYDECYARHSGRSLMMRIYCPQGPGPYPTVLSVHGGAWNSGSRDSNASLDKAIALWGTVVMAADFRQPPLAGYPDSIADLHLAARWAQAHAPRYGGRSDRIGGLGTSSGGHQLLLNALRPRDPRYAALQLEQRSPSAAPAQALHCLALCWPIANPLERYQWAQRTGLHKLVLAHERYWGDEAAMADGSPQLIIDRSEQDPVLPDLLVVQGTADDNIPAGATERFVDCYRGAGGQADLHMFAGATHGFITRDPGAPQSVEAIGLIAGFIAQQLGTMPAIDTEKAD